ncbi:MAG: CsbD family protein [Pirellulales bacterium]
MLNAQEIQGHWDTLRGKVKEKWGQLTDDDLQIVGGNVDQLVGRIQQKTGQQRREIESFLNDLLSQPGIRRAKEAVAGYAQQSVQQVQEGYEHVAKQAREGYAKAGQMVEKHPAESMAAVLGLGIIAGVAVGLMLRSD